MLFWIVLSATASFSITARPELPEMTLRSAGLGRPMKLFDANWSMTTPNELLLVAGLVNVAAVFVPMKLPTMALLSPRNTMFTASRRL